MPRKSLIASLRMPGPWRDAWLYKEHLILWRRDNTRLQVPLEDVIRAVRAAYDNRSATVLEYLLARNDRKNSQEFAKLDSVANVRDAFASVLAQTGGTFFLDPATLPFREHEGEAPDGSVIDTHVYANRVYCASTRGLFESRFRSNPEDDSMQHQALTLRIARVMAGYGSLNVSAEQNGLLHQPIFRGGAVEPRLIGSFERVAEVSYDASYVSRHLINYDDSPTPQFLRAIAEKTRATEQASFEEWLVTGYHAPRTLGPAAVKALERGSKVEVELEGIAPGRDLDSSELEVLGNSGYRLLADWRGQLRVLDVSAYEGRPVTIQPDPHYPELGRGAVSVTDVLDVHPLGHGFLVETLDSLQFLTYSGVAMTLQSGPVARVRTFPSSRRYKDVAAVVDETSLVLLGYLT